MNTIRRLRWKFVAINMLIVTALLLTISATVLLTTRQSLERDSLTLLNRVISQESTSSWPFGSGGSSFFSWPFSEESDRKSEVSLPYFTVFVARSGMATVTDSQFYDLSDNSAVAAVVERCLLEGSDSGTLPDFNLRYLRQSTRSGWLLAFSDTSQERSTLRQMAFHLLLVMGLALVALFFISHLLARWATAPVERTLKQQRQFIADASHELKTPLTVVLSNVDMLESREVETDERSRRWLENIRCGSRQMQALVEDMLVLARSDNQTARTQPMERLNLSDAVMDTVLLFEPTVYESGKTLEDDIEDELYVTGDPAKLRRLTAILLDNAQKYAKEGGNIRLSLKSAGKRVVLSVFNEGEPMTQEQISHIFERFYRADAARSTEGFGLGLSIAERTAQEHHGTIRAESSAEGNTFIVSLPKA